MFRRILCLLCAMLVLFSAVPALSDDSDGNSSYDFDLTFRMNADSFPALLQERTAGYASLVNRLGLRGTIAWNTVTESFDLEATLYFTDDPSLSYPFRLYGSKARIFFTSRLINNEIILLNMAALMEFALKAKNTLGVPMTYFAILFPYTTESAFEGIVRAWQDVIGSSTESREIPVARFKELSALWQNELLSNGLLHWWITGLAAGSDSASVVEAEMDSLPYYYENVTGGKPVTVTVTPDSETWQNAAGDMLYFREESETSLSLALSLPASGNGYMPSLSFERQDIDNTISFDAAAYLLRDASSGSQSADKSVEASDDEYSDEEVYDESYNDEYGYDDDYDYDSDYDEDEWWNESEEDFPDLLIEFHASGTDLPRSLPADSAFTLSASVIGALYPDYGFSLNGETKKDGAVTLSLIKPFDIGDTPVTILECSGTFVPSASPISVPDYMQESLEGVYNVFSFNEQKIAAFRSKVLPPLVRSIFSFVAAAPVSACQSFLDDLTDTGFLDVFLD